MASKTVYKNEDLKLGKKMDFKTNGRAKKKDKNKEYNTRIGFRKRNWM